MNENTYLLPCPFCGGDAHIVGWLDEDEGAWNVVAQCVDCAAEIAPTDVAHMPAPNDTDLSKLEFFDEMYAAIDEARTRWNWRRALTVVKEDE